MGVMDIGASALHAAHTRLQATSNNIANASTPGYSRQEVVVAAREGQLLVGGYIGGGVEVTAIEREYDQFLARELNMSQSALAASKARAESLGRLDQLFSNTENGIGARYDSFNAGIADMINQPFDDATRSVALHRATELAKTINGTHGELERIADDTLAQARSVAKSINSRLQELAEVNGLINASDTVHSNQNDLLDRRDQLVSVISESIRVNSHINDNGTVSLFGATGDALVIAQKASELSVEIDARDPGRMGLNLKTGDRDLPLNDDLIGGGKLGGLFEFYNEDLRDAGARLGQMAAALAEGYNKQQANGLDRDGQPGSALFRLSDPVAIAAPANTGNAQLSAQVVDGSALKASDYTVEMQSGNLLLTRLSDGQQTTLTGFPQVVDGLSFELDSGALAEGDIVGIRSATAIAKNFSAVMQSPSQWANAFPAIAVAGEGNRGSLASASFEVTQVGPDTTSPVTLTFTGPDSFDVTGPGTGNPTGLTYAPGEAFSFNGWTLTMTGTPELGDTLTVGPTADPSADNRNARAMLALSNEPLADGNTLTESVSSLIGEVGARTQSAKADELQTEIWKTAAQNARDSVSGVNLDEEAARLLQYQQAYQAAAKVISTAQVMFDSLLTIGR